MSRTGHKDTKKGYLGYPTQFKPHLRWFHHHVGCWLLAVGRVLVSNRKWNFMKTGEREQEDGEVVEEIEEQRASALVEKIRAVSLAQTLNEDIAELSLSNQDYDDNYYYSDEGAQQGSSCSDGSRDYDDDYEDDEESEYGCEERSFDEAMHYGKLTLENDSSANGVPSLSQSEKEEMSRFKQMYLDEARQQAAITIQKHARANKAHREVNIIKETKAIRNQRLKKLNRGHRNKRDAREKQRKLAEANTLLRRRLEELTLQLDQKKEESEYAYQKEQELKSQREVTKVK